MKRIIDKQTRLFKRDDFDFNEETEIGLDVEPAQGLYLPRRNEMNTEWVEGMAQEGIDLLKNVVVEQTEVQMLRDYVLDLDMRVIMMEFGL